MPGAQPRRSPVARVASSARRGANVPAGTPGVYRVPRVRTVMVQGSDTGAAGSTNSWIQPPDQEESIGLAFVSSSMHQITDTDNSIDSDNQIAYNAPPYGYPNAQIVGVFTGARYFAGVGFFDIAGMTFPPFEPDPGDWPPGAVDVEFENPAGVRTADPIRVAGTARVDIGTGDAGGLHASFASELARCDDSAYTVVGGQPVVPLWPSAIDLSEYSAGTLVSFPPAPQPDPAPGSSAHDEIPWEAFVDEEDASGWLGILPRFTDSFSTLMAEIYGDFNYSQALDMTNNTDGPSLPRAYVTYTPPRYRFTF